MTHNYYELLYAFHIYRHNYRKGEQLKQTVGGNLTNLIIFYKNTVFDLRNFYLIFTIWQVFSTSIWGNYI